ncbi:YdiU family protein [Nesterenkonia sp. E16_7]|uniref:protein adenylyltransferase SelO n=1 Tax=unclassified Nesterenkonia TaxID=2629769 RepID=UPI001A92D0F0|nr:MULTISPECIES: YdiU family protein [unclassified Nesterenkonia]MBO0594885.1 YdiU family protein [Nesterenkonia sp. E16_10]MBO0599821.1 YdiU family protein [Nesterenkonia sp. E16_7]
MSTPAEFDIALDRRFAQELPELSIPWSAQEAAAPRLIVLNEPLAQDLGLDPADLQNPEGVRLLVGNRVPAGATPVAQGYAGHQFGSYSPRLGDGRALLLGELTDSSGQLRDIHLKGSGRTPFARGGADGQAALGPMLREYVISEAMHALGIPTTRALAVLATGDLVQREKPLPGAVLTRVAESHLRVGSFQYARAAGGTELVRRLADHAIARHAPEARNAENPYLALFASVVSAQAELMAQWMLVGFVHGVMNTDNTTISGESIDYGPCAFMDVFDPAAVYSSIDQNGRYSYRNQPAIAEWNLARFAETLLPLFDDDDDQAIALAQEALGAFRDEYSAAWSVGMKSKLGLPQNRDDEVSSRVINDVMVLLKEQSLDYTSFFRALNHAARGDLRPVRQQALNLEKLDAWLEDWRELSPDAEQMARINPVYIPRNHLVEEALDAATDGDFSPFHQLLEVVTDPYRGREDYARYASPPPASFGPYRTFCGT